MDKWSEIILGLVLVIAPLLIAFYSQPWVLGGVSLNFWTPSWNFLKGGIFWFVFMLGALFILLGISDLKG